MLRFLAYIFASSIFVLFTVESANILAIFPYPGPGQFITAQPYLQELANRGHNVTVITNYFQLTSNLSIYRNIKIGNSFDDLIAANVKENERIQRKLLSQYHINVTLAVLENPQVQFLLTNETFKFDMVITDTLMPSALFAIARHFNASLVGISSASSELHIDNLVGNDSPISFVPVSIAGIYRAMHFFERVQNTGQALLEWLWVYAREWTIQKELYRRFFPNMTAELDEICRNFSLVLLNQHFSIDVGRPYVPNMIEVGGMYISDDPGTLPEDILNFINEAKYGVIYVSLGTHIKLHTLPERKFLVFLEFFYHSKMHFLWKFESPDVSGMPDNVLARDWFPQRAILAHPKVKLFITQGGFLSVMEAIYHGKPVVGIPAFCDHFINMKRVEHFGLGQSVPLPYLSARNLTNATHEVLTKPNYTRNAKLMQRRFQDRPTKALDAAIFWTEYILRHNGADFMRVPAKDMTFAQYYNLDIVAFLLIVTLIFIFALCQCLKGCSIVIGHICTIEERAERKRRLEAAHAHYD